MSRKPNHVIVIRYNFILEKPGVGTRKREELHTGRALCVVCSLLSIIIASLKAMCEAIQTHALFNALNNVTKPLIFFVDLRDADSFAKRRFRADRHAVHNIYNGSQDAALVGLGLESVLQQLTSVVERYSVQVICVTQHDDGGVSKELCAQTVQWVENANLVTKILALKSINFDSFAAAYPQCWYLYRGTDVSSGIQKRPAKEYPTNIVPQFLYLCGYYEATDEKILQQLNITHIVDATGAKMSAAAALKSGIQYLPVQIWDLEGVDITKHFDRVLSFIDAARESNGATVVHCRAGVSRSATFVLAYMLRAGLAESLAAALTLVVTERPYVLPNPSFREQLRKFEHSLLGTSSFEDDDSMLAHISSINHCWSGEFSRESDHDSIPVVYAKQQEQHAGRAALLEEYPDAAVAEQIQAKPKKPFLKRGAGKR
jgi:hypothetical protein